MEAKTSKKKWSPEDLEYFKNLILKQREESLKEIKRLESIARNDDDLQNNTMLDSTYAYHMADVGTDSQEREYGNGKDYNSHAPEPLSLASPEQNALGETLNICQYGGSGGCKA